MTLIQTLFNADQIIQVADRRLTWPDGSLFDDEYTKLVCWNQTFSVAFTGIARMDEALNKSTSEWIAEVLGQIHRDLGVLDAPGGAGVLALHPDRMHALLHVAGFVDDQERAGVSAKASTTPRDVRAFQPWLCDSVRLPTRREPHAM